MTVQKIKEILANRWLKCGVEMGDILLVHSSLKRLINTIELEYSILISPQIIYESFLLAIGENGTLVLPLYNFDFPTTKVFDINNTPSKMGALSEIGRKDILSIRTGHPIYSFSVIGFHQKEFMNIDNFSGYGSDSPFAKIKELKGKIAVLGLSDQDSMTSYHFVEEQNLVDYRYFKKFRGVYIDSNKKITEREYALFVRDINRGVKTDVNRMMNYFWNENLYKGEKFDEGFGLRTIDFNLFYDVTDRIIKDGKASDFLYSIEK